jgi:hypothetical protein
MIPILEAIDWLSGEEREKFLADLEGVLQSHTHSDVN